MSRRFLPLILCATALQAQVITVQNPSFEKGIPDTLAYYDDAWTLHKRKREVGKEGIFGWTPPPWEICSSTPDLMPNAFYYINGEDAGTKGVWKGAASHGNWYLGLVCHSDEAGWRESIAQPLSSPFKAGAVYTFSVDLAKAQPYTQAWNGLATGDAHFYIYGNMGNNNGCSDLNDGVNGQLLWKSPPVGHSEWRRYDMTLKPVKAWTHIYFTMPRPEECGVKGMNILIDNISEMELGELKVITPEKSSSIPCGHHVMGTTSESAEVIYISGNFQGKNLTLTRGNGGISEDGKSWEVDIIYDKNFKGDDTLIVKAEYQDPTVVDSKLAIPIFVQATADLFDVKMTYADEPVFFTDKTVEFEKTVKVTWDWSFGDGKESQVRHPSHLYKKGGLWTVQEVITYGDFPICTDTLVREINLPDNPGTMDVSSWTIENCAILIRGKTNYRPDSVMIHGKLVGAPVRATIVNDTTWMAAVYFSQDAVGEETITVLAHFPSNTVEEKKSFDSSKLISVRANFSIDSSNGLWGIIPFKDRSTSPADVKILSWEWSFGDNNFSNQQNPKHDYKSAGRQLVSLTVIGSDGCRDWKLDTLDIPTIAVADTGHKLFDTNLDGTLDRIQIRFPYEVTKETLISEGVVITFTWIDEKGNIVVIPVDLKQVVIKGDLLVWDIPEKVSIKKKLTGKESGTGVAKLEQPINTDAGVVTNETLVDLEDAMVPLVASSYIEMSTDTRRRPDTLHVHFTEEIAIETATREQLFSFLLPGDRSATGKELKYMATSYRGAGWSQEGRHYTLFFNHDNIINNKARVYPLDSIRIVSGKKGVIIDRVGNQANPKAPWIPIQGKLKPQLETNDLWVVTKDEHEKVISHDQNGTMESFGELSLFDQTATLKEVSEGQLGVLLTIVVPVLEDGMSSDSVAAELNWPYKVEFYTNLGGFVAKTQGVLRCNDPLFDDPSTTPVETCLDSRLRKVWIPWNGVSHMGRLAGSGAYIMKASFGKDHFSPRMVGLSRHKGIRR